MANRPTYRANEPRENVLRDYADGAVSTLAERLGDLLLYAVVGSERLRLTPSEGCGG